jgi:hypothetical protein
MYTNNLFLKTAYFVIIMLLLTNNFIEIDVFFFEDRGTMSNYVMS